MKMKSIEFTPFEQTILREIHCPRSTKIFSNPYSHKHHTIEFDFVPKNELKKGLWVPNSYAVKITAAFLEAFPQLSSQCYVEAAAIEQFREDVRCGDADRVGQFIDEHKEQMLEMGARLEYIASSNVNNFVLSTSTGVLGSKERDNIIDKKEFKWLEEGIKKKSVFKVVMDKMKNERKFAEMMDGDDGENVKNDEKVQKGKFVMDVIKYQDYSVVKEVFDLLNGFELSNYKRNLKDLKNIDVFEKMTDRIMDLVMDSMGRNDLENFKLLLSIPVEGMGKKAKERKLLGGLIEENKLDLAKCLLDSLPDLEVEGQECLRNIMQKTNTDSKEDREKAHAILKEMLGRGIDKNMENGMALQLGVDNRDLETIKILRDYGKNKLNPNLGVEERDNCLLRAIGTGDLEIVKNLLQMGANVNINFEKENELIPIMKAITQGNFWICKSLLNENIDVDCTNDKFQNPLHVCAQVGGENAEMIAKEIMNYSRYRQFWLNKRDCNGNTPLHYSLKNNLRDVARILKRAGARDDLQNAVGDTALNELKDSKNFLKYLDREVEKEKERVSKIDNAGKTGNEKEKEKDDGLESTEEGEPSETGKKKKEKNSFSCLGCEDLSRKYLDLLERISIQEKKKSEMVEHLQNENTKLNRILLERTRKNLELKKALDLHQSTYESNIKKYNNIHQKKSSVFKWKIPKELAKNSDFLFHIESPSIVCYGHEFVLRFYPKGAKNRNSCSLYLMQKTINPQNQYVIYFTLGILNQINMFKSLRYSSRNTFGKNSISWGFSDLQKTKYLLNPKNGYISKENGCIEFDVRFDDFEIQKYGKRIIKIDNSGNYSNYSQNELDIFKKGNAEVEIQMNKQTSRISQGLVSKVEKKNVYREDLTWKKM